tara:strand:+ start:5316 stop:5543 length:228 start_codon:yes stop_codon:yes gene_type:complete
MPTLESQLKEAILDLWRKNSMLEELSNENRRLSQRIDALEKKLDLAIQGLTNISDYADTHSIAKKTLEEIKNIKS